jgi:hypothetical protein
MKVIKDPKPPQGMQAVADALNSISTQIKYLGTGENGSLMGGMEILAIKIHEGLESVASSIEHLAQSIDDLPRSPK